MQEKGCRRRDTRERMQEARYKRQDAGGAIQEVTWRCDTEGPTEGAIQEAGYRRQARHKILDAEGKIQDEGYKMKDTR